MYQFLIPMLYLTALAVVVFLAWNEQNSVRRGQSSSPLYRNLMDNPAYIRRGFDLTDIGPADITAIPAAGSQWVGFNATPLLVRNSALPDLPTGSFLPFRGKEAEEFTFIIPIEMDEKALALIDGNTGSAPQVVPGIYIAHLGENWEVYFNGTLVRSEIHSQRRTWGDVFFPIDPSLVIQGTNVLALRIIGDPTYVSTGFTFNSPNYLDDFNVIEKRQNKFPLIALCGIFGFSGIYYLALFLFIRKRRELLNLYFSFFSILLCVYVAMRDNLVNFLIPNADISLRMEYSSLILALSVFFVFLETMIKGKITRPTWVYLAFCSCLTLIVFFFSLEAGDQAVKIWNVAVILHYTYIVIYDVIYYYFFDKKRIKQNDDDVSGTLVIHLITGSMAIYLCGIYEIIDILFFRLNYSLFPYSNFVVQIGMNLALAQRFSAMYKKLEQSNVMLETAVHERTLELEEQTAIAVDASRAKSKFLAAMSHEIRTPLNAVIGLSEIELRDRLSDISRKNIAQIHRSGSTLLGIIGDILDISKIETGKLELAPEEYDTASLISDAVNLNMVRIGPKPLQFALNINGDFPRALYGDQLRVRQILNNLLSNAIKYTHGGTITLSVEWEKREGNDVLARFAVRDTGIGIRQEDMGKLFDAYTQIDMGSNRKIEGTGLGLTITKKLVEMMGGSIAIESKYGKGSCFTAEIMQAVPSGEIECIGEETAANLRNFSYAVIREEGDIAYSLLSGGKVLIVDDNTANLSVARGMLVPYGLQLDTASSGREAIEKVQKANPRYDLIFMDHMMPEMDGVEAASLIRAWEEKKRKQSMEFPQETPKQSKADRLLIVALTANALRGMKDFYLEHGFDDYIAKPINPRSLDDVIGKYKEKLIKKREKGGADIFSFEMEEQRLDMLNHYRMAFERGHPIDAEYFEKFTALIESFDAQSMSAQTREQRTLLIEAGRRGDAQKIREILPLFYEARRETAQVQSGEGARPREIISRLKKAILSGDSAGAGAVVKELGAVKLEAQDRELYFLLNDLLLAGDTERAAGAIGLWERLT